MKHYQLSRLISALTCEHKKELIKIWWPTTSNFGKNCFRVEITEEGKVSRNTFLCIFSIYYFCIQHSQSLRKNFSSPTTSIGGRKGRRMNFLVVHCIDKERSVINMWKLLALIYLQVIIHRPSLEKIRPEQVKFGTDILSSSLARSTDQTRTSCLLAVANTLE